MKKFLFYLFLFAFTRCAFALDDSTSLYLKQHIGYLASDALEGRKSGSKGAELAALYISRQFSSCGLVPLGDSGTYFQRFTFIAGVKLGEKNSLTSREGTNKTTYRIDKDYRPLAFSANGDVSGPMVFAGYGISSTDPQYDDYANIDVQNKIVLIMHYSPTGDNPHSEVRQVLASQVQNYDRPGKRSKSAFDSNRLS